VTRRLGSDGEQEEGAKIVVFNTGFGEGEIATMEARLDPICGLIKEASTAVNDPIGQVIPQEQNEYLIIGKPDHIPSGQGTRPMTLQLQSSHVNCQYELPFGGALDFCKGTTSGSSGVRRPFLEHDSNWNG
jgi:hypothetical protein